MSLSALSDELAQVRTKKKEFLAQIDRIIPWGEWMELIRPCYYKGERGNKPYDLERMLRIYMIQNLYNLSDMATVAEVIDSRAFSDFCGVESSNQVPDGDTLGRFRNLLIKNGLQEKLFTQVVELLTKRGLILKKGTIVDSTFIEAPSSTKTRIRSATRRRIPQKRATRGTSGTRPMWELTTKLALCTHWKLHPPTNTTSVWWQNFLPERSSLSTETAAISGPKSARKQ